MSVLLSAAAAQAETPLQPMCTDRPAKGTAPCTVEAGHWQVEIDAADWTHDRADGVTSDTGVFASSNIKYGVSDRIDIELNITPQQVQQTTGAPDVRGFGDLTARAKIGLVSGDKQVAILPFAKIPTAGAGLGNGALEGGVVVPVSLNLPSGLGLTLDPEIDALKDGQGQGWHPAYSMAIGLSRALTPSLTGVVELWGSDNEDSAGALRQASFDLGLSWFPARNPSFQLDGGVNLGLNHDTPHAQFYVGVSQRF